MQWEKVKPDEWALGVRVAVTHFKPVVHVSERYYIFSVTFKHRKILSLAKCADIDLSRRENGAI